MKKYAVIVAGGAGTRMKTDLPKQFLLLNKKPVLMHTIEQFYKCDKDIKIIIVLPKYQINFWQDLCTQYNFEITHEVIEGGNTRYNSVENGLRQVPENCLVAIHDGVRPLVTEAIISNSYMVASKNGAAITAVMPKDSIRKKIQDSTISKRRGDYLLVQTPQTFKSSLLKEAYSATESSADFTDDASVFEASKKTITVIEGDYINLKITTPEDLIIAQALQENL